MRELFAGLDLGGTTIGGAIADRNGQLVCSETIATESHRGPNEVIERMIALVERLAAKAGAQPSAVGVGVPGLVDVASGVTQFLPNLPTQWRGVPVAAVMSDRLRCPVRLLNDVRAATLGERTFGAGRPVQTMAFFSLGTGVGGGVVIDGKLRLGPLGAAGELGHQTIVANGPLCGCGNRGCLETLTSGPAIVAEAMRRMLSGQSPILRDLTHGKDSLVTTTLIGQAALAGDAGANETIQRAAYYLGIGVANVVTILHPELVILGGGVAEIGPLLFDIVRSVVRDRVRMFPPTDVRIEPSALGSQAGVLGAIALALSDDRV